MDLTQLNQLVSDEFKTKKNRGWTSFHHPSLRDAGFGTSRVGKFTRSGRLLFTIGETKKGGELKLSQQLESIIVEAGLTVVREPSTAGQRRDSSSYVGFESRDVPQTIVARILEQVRERVKLATAL